MKRSYIIYCATLLAAGSAMADPTTQPTTLPTSAPPAVAPVERIADGQTLLVLPLSESSSTSYPWLGKAIQQDLLADLSRTTRVKVNAPASIPPAADAGQALQTARSDHATLVVYGQYQVVGNQVRISGQILDVQTEKPGGSFIASGSVNDLFPLEDSVSDQVLRSLPPGWVTVNLPPAKGSIAAGQPATVPPVVIQQPAPVPQYYSYTYPDYTDANPYSYYYGDYPYYGYAVPYFGPDVWFYGGWDFYHHHYWDHGFGGYGYSHGFVNHGYGHAPVGRPGGGGGFHGGGGHGGGGGHRR